MTKPLPPPRVLSLNASRKDHPMRPLIALFCLIPFACLASEDPVQVSAHGPMALAGTTLTFQPTGLVDQRCPPDADCQWEGTVRADILVVDGTSAPVTITLCNLCDGASPDTIVGNYTISIGRLAPFEGRSCWSGPRRKPV